MVVDRDGIPLVFWMPQFLIDKIHVSFINLASSTLEVIFHIQENTFFGNAVQNALSIGRNTRSAYGFAKGKISGCIKA